MLIRLATTADVPALRQLIDQSVRVLSREYYSDRQVASALTYIFGVDTQLIVDQTYYVAEEGGTIIGAGGWSKRKTLFGGDQFKADSPDPLLNPETEAARVRAFYVHPEWSRRGIGRQILAECEDAAWKAGFTRLELVATLPGEPLYSALGYRRVNPVEMAMPDGESLQGFLMEKLKPG